jgi:hypothetical protein
MTWNITGGTEGRPLTFDALIDAALVRHVLDADQLAALGTFGERLDAIADAREHETGLRAYETHATNDGRLVAEARARDAAARAAALDGELPPPAEVDEMIARRRRVLRLIAALEQLAREDFGCLHRVLAGRQAEIVTRAWLRFADANPKVSADERLARLGVVEWALHLHEGAAPPRTARLAALDVSPRLRFEADLAATADEIGREVAALVENEDAA